MEKMKSSIYVLECLMASENETFILRSGENGKFIFATSDASEFIDFLRNPQPEKFDPVKEDK